MGGMTSSKGIPLGNPGTSGYLTSVKYQSDFDTSSSATGDLTAPTVDNTVPADTATGVSTLKPIIFSFSEAMNPTTVTENSVLVKLGSSAVAGSLTYDSNNWTATFIPNYSLAATSTYTITVTTGVQDLAGNALASTLLRTFTTGNADTSSPTVVSAQANDYALKVVFSKPMLAGSVSDLNYANSVLKPANYTVHLVSSAGATQSTISTSAATITYDAPSRSVALNGITGIVANNLVNISVASAKDIGFNDIAASTAAAATTTAQSSGKTGNFTGGGMTGPMFGTDGNMMQGGMMGGPPAMVGTFIDSGIGFAPGVKVYPFNSMASVSTIYGVEIPLSYQVPNAGFIDIAFPDGTDVVNAKKDTASPPNNDLNGPGSGTVVFGTSEGTLPSGWTTGGAASDGVIVNTDSRTVRIILGAVATRRGTANLTSGDGDQHDFLRMDIAQIVNPSNATKVGMSGNSATVSTKKADGTVLETLSSSSFSTSAAGSFTVRGRVMSGASGVNGINVFLMSPMTGPQSSSTANGRFNAQDGEFMFQNLVAGTYMLGAEQFAKSGGTSYTAGFPGPINVNSTNCSSNICSQNISVVDASTGATVTLNISGTFSNDAIDIFAGGPGSFRKATSTLNGTLAGNTSNSIKLNTNGVWMVGFGPQMSTEMFGKGGPSAPTAWMPPKPQEVQVSGCPSSCSVNPSTLTFNISAANKTIKFTVKDASSNAIANANVFAYSPAGGSGNDTAANADGTGSLNLSYGSYKIGASVSGMPGGVERSILIKDDGGADKMFVDGSSTGIALSSMTSASLTLTISKPSYTISGQVTDGTNPVANAPVNAYRTDGPGHSETFTNSSGNYTLYVANGIWKVQAFAPDYGKLPEKTVTISGSSSSGQNFEPNTSSVNYATITKSVGNDADADGVFDSGEGTSNVQIIVQGTTGDLNNDGDTSDTGENTSYINSVMTDTNGSSTLKLPPGTYTMTAFSPTQGEMSSSTQSIVVNGAGTVATAPYDILAPKTGAVTINILDSSGNATSSVQAVVEFMQIGGKTDKVESWSGVASSTISLPQYDVANALNAVTSTNPTNMYLMNVTIPGVSDSSLNVSGADSNTVLATSTAASGYWKVEVDANTESINIRLPAINYVSGTVKDADGTAVPGATVHLENSSTNEKVDVLADTSGNYSAKVSNATYLVSATKDGYIDTASSVAISASGALADSATTMTAAAYTISGTITAGSSAASGATVRAEKLGGGIVTATTATDGTYSLKVINGNWKISAAADGYTESTYSSIVAVSGANVSGKDITLSTTATSLSGSTSQSLTPQNGGSMNDSSAGVSVNSSEGALANSANPYSLNEKEVSNVVGGNAGTPVSGEAKTVSSYDNDGNAVTLLNSDVSVGASYSNSVMTTALGALTLVKLEKVNMASWDDTADNWQTLPTTIGYKDSSGKFIEPSASASTLAYTGQTSHFSSFNPIAPSDGMAPSAPANVAAVAGNATVSITWTANSEGDLQGYDIYRSSTANGTFSSLGSATTNSYTDSSAVNGSTYYYRITATDTGGLESEFSSASNSAAPVAPTTGGAGATIVQPAPKVTTTSVIVGGNANALTSLDVVLKFNVTDAVQMAISEKTDFSGSSWESYVTTKSFKLSDGLGAKKLYIKFRTSLGGVSEATVLDLNIASISATPATVPATAPVASTATVQPKTVASSVPGEITISTPSSKVAITDVVASSYQPGDILKFSYEYQNDSAKAVSIKIVRQLLNSKGKVVSTASAVKTIKTGKSFQADISEAVNKKLTAGEYIVKVKILNAKTGKLIDENSFNIQVEKLKKKMFIMGGVSNSASDIAFDETILAKIKSNVPVPTMVNFHYSYTNNTEAKQVVKMVRQLLGADGKIMQTGSGKWTMKAGENDSLNVKQPVAVNLSAGNYSIRIVAYDWKTKELLTENSLFFSIELK
ncbi:MAG: carboxypeptidase regulatory-like domain-containing protein [Candidatus Magasanikbacteria bacterium]|nr:carboxypeptidase regulatory-like domain-containing protein [Candidatus Magasanikbacteria bacterium]